VLVALALLVGFLARTVAVDGSDSPLLSWLPWNSRTTVTLFFGDSNGEYLVPVSRTVSGEEAEPAALVDSLLAGPEAGTSLVGLVPTGTEVQSIDFADGQLAVDLGGTYSEDADLLSAEAIYQSMRSWPDVTEVTVTVDGQLLETNTTGHLLYFYDEGLDRLVAQTTNRVRAEDVVLAYLDGPSDTDLIGLPAEVQLLSTELGSNELLTLRFTFPDELGEFAVDHPDSVRRVLEGLIATFNTGFPDVGGVLLDFEGHNALGLGQCANLLNTVQQMPEVLNDERLLTRNAVGT
jgi:spore germination protein GerM